LPLTIAHSPGKRSARQDTTFICFLPRVSFPSKKTVSAISLFGKKLFDNNRRMPQMRHPPVAYSFVFAAAEGLLVTLALLGARAKRPVQKIGGSDNNADNDKDAEHTKAHPSQILNKGKGSYF
jgi:hypothetical protein